MFNNIQAIKYAINKTKEIIKEAAKKQGISYEEAVQSLIKGDEKIANAIKEVINNK